MLLFLKSRHFFLSWLLLVIILIIWKEESQWKILIFLRTVFSEIISDFSFYKFMQ